MFRVTHTDLDAVYVKESSTAEEKRVPVRKSPPSPHTMPATMVPPGLSQERKDYLFRHVRPIVSEEAKNYIASVYQEE